MPNSRTEHPWLTGPREPAQERVRLICFPHAGAGPSSYHGWQRSLPAELQLSIAHLPGRERRIDEAFAPDLAFIVDALTDAIAPLATRVPYAVFGHSFGALIGFEVMHALRARGLPEPVLMFASGAVGPSETERLPPCAQLPDDELLEELRQRYGGIPSALDRDADLLAHFCRVLRADIGLLESYCYRERPLLRFPIVTLRGVRDPLAPERGVAAWQAQTCEPLRQYEFAGGHFFVRSDLEGVTRCVASELTARHGLGRARARPIRSIAEWVERAASVSPDSLAVWGPDGRLCYGELDAEANRVAHALVEAGVAPGDRVALWLEKSTRAVAIMQGILRARAVYVPIDPNSPAPRALAVINDAGAKAVFTDPQRATRLGDGGPRLYALDLNQLGARAWATHATTPCARPPACLDDLAYVLYTSGSTGVPKGVCLSHRNASAFVEWAAATLGIRATDALANHAPFHFDLSVLDLYGAFWAGASVHLIPELMSYVPRHLVEFLGERQISILYAVPSVLRMMVDEGGLLAGVRSLRHVIFAGEPYPIDALRKLRNGLRDCRMFNFYGPTETNVCTFYEVTTIETGRTRPVPIGMSASAAELWARRADGEQAAVHEEGELIVDGPTVMLGYWGRPPQHGPYPTGDLVRVIAPGEFEYIGRTDDLVKVRGMRIEPGEIEACLVRATGVRQAAVVTRGKELEARLVAFLVSGGGPAPNLLELKRHCAAHLPRQMIPDEARWLQELPRTPNGKIDRRKLARMASDGVERT